jgi:putative flippase GtrA
VLLINTCSYSSGTVNSYLWNKYWTFGDFEHRHGVVQQFPRFVVFNLIGLAISNILVVTFALFLPLLIAKLFAVAGTAVWNYWTSAKFVYRGTG